MPTARFEADFSSFSAATKKAEGNVAQFQTTSTRAFGTFTEGVKSADKTLNALGVNIGPQVRAIEELGAASGKTASQIGAVGTATLVATAALAGWQVGRKISEFFDLDKKIGEATAKMMGWGDVAGEVAAAKADQLAAASQRAGRAITDLTEAQKINAEFVKQQAAPSYDSYMQAAANAHRQFREMTEENKRRALVLHEQGIGEAAIAKALGTTEGAIKVLLETNKVHQEQQRISKKLAEERAEAESKVAQAIEDQIRTEYRQLAAIQARGEVYTGTLPKILEMENEQGVAMDETTKRAKEGLAAWTAGQTDLEKAIEEGRQVIAAFGGETEKATGEGKQGVDAMTASVQRLSAELKLAVPAGFSFTKAYTDAGFIVHGSLAGSSVRSKSYGGVTQNFYGGFYDTPSGQAEFYNRFGNSALAQLGAQGARLG